MLHAVIMAGGSGTRFWPVSRADSPKQLLSLVGGTSMIRQTVDRLRGLVETDQTLVVTNERLVDAMRRDLPDLPPMAIVGEPCKRDTAPCIGLAALLVSRNDPDATMAVMPADHVIEPTDQFQSAIRQAVAMVEQSPQRIVTFGIAPTYPAEIFGYIERGEKLTAVAGDVAAFRVKRFREKPNASTAKEFVSGGNYYWNSGIFVWKAKTILDALRSREPEMLPHLEAIVSAWDTPQQSETFTREFTTIRGISIDFAVMEHATDVAVIEAPFEWDDLGGWQSLARRLGVDASGNTIVGKHLGLATQGTIVHTSDDHLIVTLGLEDCIVVRTKDATLVARKDQEEAIREIVKELETRRWIEHL